MSEASTFGDGMCMGFPNVNKTEVGPAVVPLPYPSIGELAMADPGTCSLVVIIVGMPTATIETMLMMSEGDEPGELGGVISQIFSGPCKFTLGSSVVMVEGMPCAFSFTMIGMNGEGDFNVPDGVQIEPSQFVVMVMP